VLRHRCRASVRLISPVRASARGRCWPIEGPRHLCRHTTQFSRTEPRASGLVDRSLSRFSRRRMGIRWGRCVRPASRFWRGGDSSSPRSVRQEPRASYCLGRLWTPSRKGAAVLVSRHLFVKSFLHSRLATPSSFAGLDVRSALGVLAAATVVGLSEGGVFTSRCLAGQPIFVVRVVSASAGACRPGRTTPSPASLVGRRILEGLPPSRRPPDDPHRAP